MKKIGLIINPLAGIGGSVGLKGSDGEEIQRIALSRGAVKRSQLRAKTALEYISEKEFAKAALKILCGPGEMGELIAQELQLDYDVIQLNGRNVNASEHASDVHTTGMDTEQVAKEMVRQGVDLVVFAGGDGTARNVYNAVGDIVPVLGIPAGVKIHSGVFATSPDAAGTILINFLSSNLQTRLSEVIDLDEEVYRTKRISDTLYGYMRVLKIKQGMQNAKAASHNSEEDISGIKHELLERMDELKKQGEEIYFIIGAGSTLYSVKKDIDKDASLLGVDVYVNGDIVIRDATEHQLLELSKKKDCRLIVTPIGGQGHIFGRGNQQISPEVIRHIGIDKIWVTATASKIYGISQQTLIVDTGDSKLDKELKGYMKVIVGWQETLVCRVA